MVKYFNISIIPLFLIFIGNKDCFNIPFLEVQEIELIQNSSITINQNIATINDDEVNFDFLKDQYKQYIRHSKKSGIKPLRTNKEVFRLLRRHKIVAIDNKSGITVDTMNFSFPMLTQKSANLLYEIGTRFQNKVANTNLAESKIHFTSGLRTFHTVKRLKKKNANALKMSSHLHGTSFDIAYDEFVSNRPLTKKENIALKTVLADVLTELKNENRCWVTYEIFQSCFHIVSK